MLSSRCKQRNTTIIPSLLNQHDAVLMGNVTTIDLSTAENWLVKGILLDGLEQAVGGLSKEALAYSSGIGGCPKTRQWMANLLNCRFHPAKTVDPSHIVLAAGGSFALTALVEQICDPGDGILIATPYWAGLDISISVHYNATIIPVHVPLSEFFRPESVQYYEMAIENASVPVKAVLLCNPHNPLGQCYPREALQGMLEFCQRRNLHYISDEVYALSAHSPVPVTCTSFISALQLSTSEIWERIHVIYSLSKDFGCSGIRVGALITQNNDAIRLSCALSVHSQVSSVSTTLAAQAILYPEMVQKICGQGGKRLQEAYQLISSFLDGHGIDYVPVAYGMFVFAKLGMGNMVDVQERNLLSHLKAVGVSVSTGTSYHFKELGWFRICYGVPPGQLREGLRRIQLGLENFAKDESEHN
ncbi:hypothetical protein P175DRAFT_0445906 [Aspergillus ochraceoroseus IBT 24754]|uniref:Aminotransferase class I/classII large domain-containing protein n=2 Tax=Aspergillus ochraceoroseus TaxID=138278 RepID=A0A2T5LM84_9EURO|nr:uncharacterized protein P175DRAFT_0445906 [Aspergillus ochraceoroseus IBT 24754]KKK25541.1 hypothetical protein AOCH_001362 [Aspergillus ochraceoroseus]PTU17398.1 hypothetical protein P175DRAFT_0445906 [Aspergillus ochraceoroseus IBT 24754]